MSSGLEQDCIGDHTLKETAHDVNTAFGDHRKQTLNPHVDYAAIEQAVRQILEAVGEDPERDGLRDTPGARSQNVW